MTDEELKAALATLLGTKEPEPPVQKAATLEDIGTLLSTKLAEHTLEIEEKLKKATTREEGVGTKQTFGEIYKSSSVPEIVRKARAGEEHTVTEKRLIGDLFRRALSQNMQYEEEILE